MSDQTENPADKPEDKGPEFDGDFDPEKAKRLAANLRAEVAELKARNAALTTERDDFKAAAEKSGTERDEALKAALDRAADAERKLALKDAGLPDDVVEEFSDYLTGTAEEVAAKAAKLAARLAPKEEPQDKGDEDPEPQGDDEDEEPVGSRPEPKLTPGHGGSSSEPFDPAAIAKAARRS